jgi:hypothetical protein
MVGDFGCAECDDSLCFRVPCAAGWCEVEVHSILTRLGVRHSMNRMRCPPAVSTIVHSSSPGSFGSPTISL